MRHRPDEGVRARLSAALKESMRARDRDATGVLRSALAALDNAEAVDPATAGLEQVEHERIAGTVGGLGAGEVPRATLDEERARAVVAAEVAERRAAADDYDRVGEAERARELRGEAHLLERLLG
jgi:uncharacterized protein YqeY